MDEKAPKLGRLLLRFTAYVGAYLAGIITCIAFTPAEMVLAGKSLLDVDPWFSLLGFLFFFFGYGAGTAQFWYVGSTAFIVMAFGIATFFVDRPWLVALRPWLFAFPVGFVGALGAYYTAAASI